jgi:hypothetical protein
MATHFFFDKEKYNRMRELVKAREKLDAEHDLVRELGREVRRKKEKNEAYSQRLWLGIFGATAIIGPMLLMVLHHDLVTNITTASVATALFVGILTIAARDMMGKEVITVTAAYAAVLVVLVGTSMPPVK